MPRKKPNVLPIGANRATARGPKPKGKPPKEKKYLSPLKMTVRQREAMFIWWYENGRNTCKTARQFKLPANTLRNYAEAGQWHASADLIDRNIRRKTEQKIVAREVSLVVMAETILDAEYQAYKKRNATGDLSQILKFMEYIDSVKGNLPGSGGGLDDKDTDDSNPDEVRRSQNALAALAAAGASPSA
jgi:hypothetical protein